MSLGNLCQCSVSLRVKICFLNVQKKLPVSGCSHCLWSCHWVPSKRAWLHPLCPLPSGIYIRSYMYITCHIYMYITYTYTQSQLSQPFLIQKTLQFLNLVALHWTLLNILVSPREPRFGHSTPGVTSPVVSTGEGSSFHRLPVLCLMSQGPTGHLYGKGTLLVYVWCGVYQKPWSFSAELLPPGQPPGYSG